MTGGGDAPGLNGIIEATVRALANEPIELVGIRDGFEGIYTGTTVSLSPESVLNAHALAGTLLGTSNKSGTRGHEDEFLLGNPARALGSGDARMPVSWWRGR